MQLVFSLPGLIVLGTIAIFSLCYIFYRRLLFLSANLLNVVFIVAVLVCSSTVLAPTLYDTMGHMVLERVGIRSELKQVDGWVGSIEAVPQQIIDSLKNPFSKDIPEVASKEGYLESQIYPRIVWVFSVLFRITFFVLGVILLLCCIYFRYSTAGITTHYQLEKKVQALEQKLIVFETQQKSIPSRDLSIPS